MRSGISKSAESPSSGTRVYEGMIVGENSRDNDLDVNLMRAKQLNNIRTHSKDEAIRLTPVMPLTLEQSIVTSRTTRAGSSVTPKSIVCANALWCHFQQEGEGGSGVILLT
jgi:GTP-binding protein